jgi:hypothetical protein
LGGERERERRTKGGSRFEGRAARRAREEREKEDVFSARLPHPLSRFSYLEHAEMPGRRLILLGAGHLEGEERERERG